MVKNTLDRYALILVEALYFGDVRAAERNGLSKRSILNYRNRLATDKDLARLFLIKKEAFERDWIETIPAAIRAGTEFLMTAFNKLEPTAENVHAVAGAMKMLADIGLTKEMFDAKFGKVIGEEGTGVGQVEAAGIVTGETV